MQRNNLLSEVISGGYHNIISDSASCSVISGGTDNKIDTRAHHSVIPGGGNNTIEPYCSYSLAFGNGVTVNDSKVAAFYSETEPGKLSVNNPNPHSTLQADGSFALAIAEDDTGDYYLGVKDYTIVITDWNCDVYLPNPSGLLGRIYVIKNRHDSGGFIWVYCNFTGTSIDGTTWPAGVRILEGDCIMVQSNGRDTWYVLPVK